MEWTHDCYFLSTEKDRLQLDRIYEFLSTKAYWSPGVSKEKVINASMNSLTLALIHAPDNLQVGYARIVTDYTTIAYLCDVYVEDEHRNKGLSKWMMRCIMETLAPMDLRRVCLATKDAHDLYRQFGFEITKQPERWMEIKKSVESVK
jgi:N-acetylglutamate synthase-like GNAT family acetyltransferase